MREHNYWVAKLHAAQPSLTGDQLYDMARSITTAEYQAITHNEYLPTLLGKNALGAYHGYDPKVSTQILEEFSTAAFRFGHTIISTTETKIANDGSVLEAKDLIQAMMGSTSDTTANGGFDALSRNLAQDFSNQEGVHIASDLLNLFNPGAPGSNFDLGAVDNMDLFVGGQAGAAASAPKPASWRSGCGGFCGRVRPCPRYMPHRPSGWRVPWLARLP